VALVPGCRTFPHDDLHAEPAQVLGAGGVPRQHGAASYSSLGARTGAAFALAQQALLAADQGDRTVAEACARESLAIVAQDGIHIFGPGLVTHIALLE
jgi:hypothetical protein